MSRSQNLRRSVVNQIIEGIAKGHIPSPLPVQSALAEMYNISRTTVRHMLSHLEQRGVLEKIGSDYIIIRKPTCWTVSSVLKPRWKSRRGSLSRHFSQ